MPFEQLKNGLLLVDGEVRVHRSCGFVPNVGSTVDRDCFTRTGTHQVAFCKSSLISEPGKAMLWLYWQLFPPDQRLPLRVQRGFLQHVLTSRLPLPNPPSISSSSPSFHVLPVKPNLFHKYSKPSLTQYGEEFSFRITFCQYRPRMYKEIIRKSLHSDEGWRGAHHRWEI